jgi:NADH-quinone oxidoreductase subunit L
MAYQLIGLAVFLPLGGFLVNGLLGRKIRNETIIGLIGNLTVGAGFVIACLNFIEMLGLDPSQRSRTLELFQWIGAGGLSTSVGYTVDQLSVLMMLVVTGVGLVIHVYSIGYMHGDPGFARFFAYMNLFIFAMLTLILADNFLLMFLGWEGVGLCSYLLIGFWYQRDFEKGTTGDAAKKAFIVNRVGDFGFLVGMFLIYTTFGTLSFQPVFARASLMVVGAPVMFWITLALFLGATGKSAQIPLFVWLPDAMAGPTPVSALIHAATMVTAGVYMVARCSVLYALAPTTMEIVAVIGTATALLAASIGLVQNDIKKVLAYSTISQLGYMFLAMGVGAFTAGIFHVMTHAFFKALLFLGSGSVIHAMHDEQNIQKMGGLRGKLPVTYATFLVATISISGIPPFAGFFSKDEILGKAFASGHVFLWVGGVIGAALTAFYMFRLLGLTFEGERRWESGVHPHEAPRSMTIPLIILALLSLIGGFVGVPSSLGGGNAIEQWLGPVFEQAREKLGTLESSEGIQEYLLMSGSVVIALLGVFLARQWYGKWREVPERLAIRLSGTYKLLLNKYYVDEVYDAAIVKPIVKGSEYLLWKIVDTRLIDGLVNGVARMIGAIGRTIRYVQTGVAQNYVLVFLAGVVLILGWLLLP